MTASLLRRVRLVMTLLGGFLLGMHGAVLLHELGHALGYLVAGGTVTRVVMQAPLPFGHVTGTAPDPRPPVWGGVAFGTLFTLIPLVLAGRLPRTSVFRLALLLVAAFSLGHNALYLVVGGMHPFADAAGMVQLGAPQWLLLLLGAPLLAGFVCVLAAALETASLGTPSAAVWIARTEAGLLPLPAAMVLPVVLSPTPSPMKTPMALLLAAYAASFAVAALLAWRRAPPETGPGRGNVVIPQRWSSAGWLWLGAAGLIGLELAVMRP